MSLYFGKVTFFDSRSNKRFGFIRVDGGTREVFFHLNNHMGVGITMDADTYFFEKKAERIPKVGDRIVFEEGWGRKGPTAEPWSYEADWKREEADNKANPIYTVEVWGGDFGGATSYLDFRGTLDQLNECYPRTADWSDDEIGKAFTDAKEMLLDPMVTFTMKEFGKESVEIDDPRTSP